MNHLTATILNTIQNHSIRGIPRADNQIHPYYDGLSIANIPASICRWLGCPPPMDKPLAEAISTHFKDTYQHIIFVVVDGLGLEFLHKNHFDEIDGNPLVEWKSCLKNGLLTPLTSIAPSTTSAALTTFWTGKLPIQHGIIGYELFLKEYGLIANMITHSVASFSEEKGNLVKAGFDPKRFLPVATLGSIMRQHGIQPFALQHNAIANSGLSQMLFNNVGRLPYLSLQEMWKTAYDIHSSYSREKTFTYLYWSEMDTLSHRSGPNDSQLVESWKDFSHSMYEFLQNFRAQGKSKTLFILTADHGQIPTGINADYDLHNHPEFIQHLSMMPSGETRMPFLFTKPGHEQVILDYMDSHWSGNFSMYPSDEILSCGFFGDGEAYQGTIDRTGNYIVFPKNHAYWWWANKDNHLLGRHGGLSHEEMLVPFFAMEL